MATIRKGKSCLIPQGYAQAVVTNESTELAGLYEVRFRDDVKQKEIEGGATQLTHIHEHEAVVINLGETSLSVANGVFETKVYSDAFSRAISEADVIVRKVFPYARFCRAVGHLDDEAVLRALEAEFWNPQNTSAKINLLRRPKPGSQAGVLEFSRLELLPDSLSRHWEIIELALLPMDSGTAIRRLREAGYRDHFTDITLDKPFSTEVLEARYGFVFPSLQSVVYVGVLSGAVTQEDGL